MRDAARLTTCSTDEMMMVDAWITLHTEISFPIQIGFFQNTEFENVVKFR